MRERTTLRTSPIPALFAVALAMIATAFCLVATPADAIDGTGAMGFITSKQQCGPFSHLGYYEAQDGAVSYCMNQDLPGPGTPMKSYDKGWVWINDSYAAIVLNGYPYTRTFGNVKLSEEDARAATQIAIWMVSGTTKPDGSYSYTNYSGAPRAGSFAGAADITRAARWLYEGATSGSLKAPRNRAKRYIGIWDGNAGTSRQDMLYVVPTVEVTVTKTSSDASITASNGEYALSGATFDVFEAASNTKVATVTTGDKGSATCELAPDTAYYLVETKAPKGFAKAEGRIPFSTDSQGGSVSVPNRPATARVALVKRDSATDAGAQPGAALAGAEFRCVSTTVPGWSQTATTDDEGRLTFENIPLGEIAITETKAPEGYVLDSTVHTLEAHADQMIDADIVELDCKVADTPIAFDIEVSKFKDAGGDGSGLEQPAAGVVFDIISNSTGTTVGSISTNEQGFADTSSDKGLWFGSGKRPKDVSGALPYDRAGYTVRERADTVPAGFKHAGDWAIDAKNQVDGIKLQYIVDNHALSTHIQIVKVDRASGNTVALAGFRFQLLDSQKEPISQECWYPNHVKLDTFTTDASGCVTLPEALRPGTYYVREAAAQAPYLLDESEHELVIPDDQDLTPVCMVTMADDAATGSVKIIKRDKQHKEKLLAGAEFDIIARETLTASDGRVQAVEGQAVAHMTTDGSGQAEEHGLPLGAGTAHYAIVETKAPAGYLLDETPHEFTLSYQDEKTAEISIVQTVDDDFTKVDISKTDISGSKEVEGAHLIVRDLEGDELDSWTSGSKPHRIEKLTPGRYTLTETLSPRTYDVAEQIEFEVKATGKVQAVSMKDAPIEISAQVDKRQQIVMPTAAGTVANGDGANRADAVPSDDGSFSYTLDARNTSNTWVDEFTVEDDLTKASELADLVSLTTPQAYGDYDGLCNIWYRTNLCAENDGDTPEAANATKDDGHENPWLDTDEVKGLVGDDARKLDYTGWNLWKRDVETGTSETLDVADLRLKNGERITGIRLEYGRVEKGFTTRDDADLWKRDDLKDAHDDIGADKPETEDGKASDSDERTLSYRPGVVNMHVRTAYKPGTKLENTCSVHAFRNGGGDKLEAHDEDRVEQLPGSAVEVLPQTGIALGVGLALVAPLACLFALFATRRRTR